MTERTKLIGSGAAAPPPYAAPPAPAQPPPAYYQNQRPPNVTAQPYGQAGHNPYQPGNQTTVVIERRIPVAVVRCPPPPDYMGYAIFATICCFPLGILAIMMAGKVRENVRQGNISEAYNNAFSARILCRLSYSFGTLIYVGTILGIVLPLTLDNDPDY